MKSWAGVLSNKGPPEVMLASPLPLGGLFSRSFQANQLTGMSLSARETEA